MKKRILTLGAVLALVTVLVVPMAALAVEDTVVCTVSGKLVALTVEDGTVAYGALAITGTQDTATGVVDHQTVTNTGTVQEDFTIKSSDAVSDDMIPANDWHLGETVGAVDIFLHKASIAAPASPSWTIAMTVAGTYVGLKADVPDTSTFDFDLQITMPTTVTDYGAHTITVTVLAVEG